MHSICPASDQLVGVLWESTLPSRPLRTQTSVPSCVPHFSSILYILCMCDIYFCMLLATDNGSVQFPVPGAIVQTRPKSEANHCRWWLDISDICNIYGPLLIPMGVARTPPLNHLLRRPHEWQFCHSLRQFVCQRAAFDQLIRKQSWRVIFFIHCCNWLALLLLMPPYFYAMVAIAFYSLFVHYQLNGKTTSKLRT